MLGLAPPRAANLHGPAPRRRAGRGFSLLEVLVASAGTLLLLTLVYGAMVEGTRNAKKTEGELVSQSEALGGTQKLFSTLRLTNATSITTLSDPPALAFLAADQPAPAGVAPPPVEALELTGFNSHPLAWKRMLVYHLHQESRQLRCSILPYPAELEHEVCRLSQEWLRRSLPLEPYPFTIAARSVEAISFTRTRPPGVGIDLTVLRMEAGQKQETRLTLYVLPRNG